MHIHRYCSIILAVFCCAGSLPAQQLSFHNISSITPLPSVEVRKLYQDSDGYLWISTYGGLLRYDGYDFLSIKMDKSTGRQLLSSSVNMVREDASHTLWIGTNDGLFALDKSSGTVSKAEGDILSNSHIEAILPTPDGKVWVATNMGLFVQTEPGRGFEYCTDGTWGILPTDMKALALDDAGYLWIGTWDDGLIRYDIKARKSRYYLRTPEIHSSHTLLIDSDKNLWIGTWGSGLVKLLNPYSDAEPELMCWRASSSDRSSILDDIIYTLAQNPADGNLWIGSRSGVSVLSRSDFSNPQAKFSNFSPTDGSLPFNEINSIISTKDNTMWLGSRGGGVFYTSTRPKAIGSDPLDGIRRRYGTSSVRALSLAPDGALRLSIAGHGFFSYDPSTGRYSHCELDAIQDFLELPGGEALIGTERGIFRTHGNGMPVFLDIKGFSDPFITRFFRSSDGSVWIGTRKGLGMLRDGEFIPLGGLLAPGQSGTRGYEVYDIAEDARGRLWVATASNGVYRLKPGTDGWAIDRIATPLTDGALCLFVDSSSRIWAGTQNGLLLLRGDGTAFSQVREDDPFLSSGTVVTNIWEDRRGSLLLATNRGLMITRPDKDGACGEVHIYSERDGLLDWCFPRHTAVTRSDGTVILGSGHGLQYIPLMDIPTEGGGAEVTVTDFKVFDRSIRELPVKVRSDITPSAIDRSKEFRLKHNQNNFTIEFSLLDFRNAESAIYSYKLDGYDPDWVTADARHRTAYYNNLRPGTYHFLVRAAGTDSGWTRPADIAVSVKPAPWATWWAWCLYVGTALAIIFFFLKLSLNRMQMQKRLELAEINRKKSEELNHTKLQFFTNITHELMTPLTIIIAAVEELREEDPSKKQYNFITDNAMRLMRLIQQILEFRKAESGNLKLKVMQGDVSAFVGSCVEAFRPLAEKRHISFSFSPASKTPITGYFDSDKLDKILYNLLSNAAKYGREGGKVDVSIDKDISGRNLILKVSDDGEGMSPEQLEHLFQRFYDGDYRKHNTIGTGIGLSLVKNLVDLHHGTISVDSRKGEGTVFTVLLPLSRDAYTLAEREDFSSEAAPQEQTDAVTAEAPAASEASPEKPSVLVVEDNYDLLQLIREHLERNYSVTTALTADEALPLLKKKEGGFNIILSDIMMPGMNGYDFCATIKKTFEWCHIPVILLTAKQTSADKIAGYEVGADAYLTKPFDLKVLDAVIAGQLRRIERTGADYRRQIVFTPGELHYTSMDEKFLRKAVDYVNAHIGDFDFSLTEFTEAMNMSRSTMAEKMKSLTGMTPSSFVNDIRLRTAAALIGKSQGKIRVSDLAYEVGFNDPKYFSTLFKKKFGVSPGEYSGTGGY